MSKPEIVWEEPPEPNQSWGKHPKVKPRKRARLFDGVLPMLRSNPGRWARIRSYDVAISAKATALRYNRWYTDVEFTSRRTGPDQWAVYGRAKPTG